MKTTQLVRWHIKILQLFQITNTYQCVSVCVCACVYEYTYTMYVCESENKRERGGGRGKERKTPNGSPINIYPSTWNASRTILSQSCCLGSRKQRITDTPGPDSKRPYNTSHHIIRFRQTAGVGSWHSKTVTISVCLSSQYNSTQQDCLPCHLCFYYIRHFVSPWLISSINTYVHTYTCT